MLAVPKFLVIMDGIAALAFPDACPSEEHRISVCRDDAIHMAGCLSLETEVSASGVRTSGRQPSPESTDSQGTLERTARSDGIAGQVGGRRR